MRVPRLPIASVRHFTSSLDEKIFGAVRAAGIGALLLTSVAAVGSGCLDRPVVPATPDVTARVFTGVKQNKVSKIDLLFMIDNSSSMADKQAILSQAVPDLVKRLIEPKCVDKDGHVVGDALNNHCANGVLDFEPIKDIHIGMISSSLGSHGASGVCEDAADSMDRHNPHNNDRGHLITRDNNDANVATFGNKGFLTYNPSTTGALGTVAQVVQPFRAMVEGVGQHGCGYEASLESIYRFLIDPEPFNTLTIDTSAGFPQAKLVGIDQELLKQRADFLRSDSLVSIMIVTDENDCSVMDGDQGFYPLVSSPTGGSAIGRGTSACLTNPNDACCFSCNALDTPAGCRPATNDSECTKPPRVETEDPRNLRCFNQKQKYGQNFLYPVNRYIDGFSNPKVPNRKGELVGNPLYSDLLCKPDSPCEAVRDKSLVFVAGITGVPWQLISKDQNTLAGGYKSVQEIHDENLWVDLVGTAGDATSAPKPPRDPHMIESVTPRMGLAAPGSSVTADPIHGHEWEPSKLDGDLANSDLQYACTFALPAPKPCELNGIDCDCTGSPAELANTKNPLCQSGAEFTRNQLRAKAYPATRILQVLEGLDPAQTIVASICPVHVDVNRINEPDYGYTPAIQALISRLRTVLRGRCLPRPIEVKPDGTVPCIVIEAFDSNGPCTCEGRPGRIKPDPKLDTRLMKDAGDCFCEMQQIEDPAKADLCKTNVDPGDAAGSGWCYIDPTQGKDGKPDLRQCDLVSKCSETERHLIKFVNSVSEPRPGATAFIMCQEQAFDPATAGKNSEVCKGN